MRYNGRMKSNDTEQTQPSPAESEPDAPGKTIPSEVSQEPAQGGLEVTQPTLLQDGAPLGIEPEPAPVNKKKGSLRWWAWALLGLLLLVLVAGGSIAVGSNAAKQERLAAATTVAMDEASKQFDLALQDIAAGNYARAQQRLEYVIQLDPNFPNAMDKLAIVLIELRTTATPTIAPTPTLTPTPDTRGRDELYTQAQASLLERNWTVAIETLLTLRKRYPDFNAVQVDGMLFVALRNRGVDRISFLADLEGGTYDLALAERFGPLDAEANNYRDWAELYIRGASYWNVDWAQAVYYFSQLSVSAPNLTDASGWTSRDRYLKALLGYGDYLAQSGDWCAAQEQYDTYMTLVADAVVEPTAVYAADECSTGDTGDATPIPTLTGITPTPTPTPTSEVNPSSAETPYP